MRIIAGTYRGVALASVGKGDAEAHLRPTSDRVREALFSMLTHHDVIENARVLDLFAGTGALGLEALSRGAAEAVFVEKGRPAQRLISENIEKLRLEDRTTLMRSDATRLAAWPMAAFDLVFLDPPYGRNLGQVALDRVARGGWIATNAMVVWEENAPMQALEGFERIATRKYGDTHVTLLCYRANGNRD